MIGFVASLNILVHDLINVLHYYLIVWQMQNSGKIVPSKCQKMTTILLILLQNINWYQHN